MKLGQKKEEIESKLQGPLLLNRIMEKREEEGDAFFPGKFMSFCRLPLLFFLWRRHPGGGGGGGGGVILIAISAPLSSSSSVTESYRLTRSHLILSSKKEGERKRIFLLLSRKFVVKVSSDL